MVVPGVEYLEDRRVLEAGLPQRRAVVPVGFLIDGLGHAEEADGVGHVGAPL